MSKVKQRICLSFNLEINILIINFNNLLEDSENLEKLFHINDKNYYSPFSFNISRYSLEDIAQNPKIILLNYEDWNCYYEYNESKFIEWHIKRGFPSAKSKDSDLIILTPVNNNCTSEYINFGIFNSE